MRLCPECHERVPDGASFCSGCGSRVGLPGSAEGATIATPRFPSTPLPGAGKFAPGTIVQERYRIVGLLGRGGMGDVYRADDLTLGQPVALKFLPEEVTGSAERRERFYGEVRVARQVAHPNVCRVYDVGEIGGRLFLSMEFVDGEDLSSLLRRIGRVSHEKAVQIARQLCAGIAALHERGVLHRDLKPANVMVDGRGGVRITDFGLSALAEEIGDDVRAGTPAYMAPEQLAGQGVDVRSDVYALGLTLYEVFTGRRAFAADTPAELDRLQRETTPTNPSEIVPDLHPAVERVIARCLEKDPSARPPGAIAVAAALPGGDPLAAALAAGEIPSLEMVAAAGERGGVRPLVGILCVAAVVVSLVLFARFNSLGKLAHWDPMEKPPAVLVDRAREILATLGHDEPFRDSAHGFLVDSELLAWLADHDESVDRWERLRDARPAAVLFWYRQSPRPLLPLSPAPIVAPDDPPPLVPGMARVLLDTRGRLAALDVVPPELGEPGAPAPASWAALTRAAGLDEADLRVVPPEWLPPHHSDERIAWLGGFPGEDGVEMRFEASALGGRPVHFRTIGPWTEPFTATEEPPDPKEKWGKIFLLGVITFVLFGGVFLALHNVRRGRGDVRSARRLTIGVFFILGANWMLTAKHSSDFNHELNRFLLGAALALLVSATLWCFYLALEPYVRKWWPDQLVAWSRVLTGSWRDPIVGRDILVGGVFFLFLTLPDAIGIVTARAGGRPLGVPTGYGYHWLPLGGVGAAIGSMLSSFLDAIFYGMFFLLCVLFLRILLRSHRAALAVFALLVGLAYFMDASANEGNRAVAAVIGLGCGAGYSLALLRFGLLPLIFGFFLRNLTTRFPIVLGGGAWYAGVSAFAGGIVVGLAAYGLWVALAGKSVYRDWLPGDPARGSELLRRTP